MRTIWGELAWQLGGTEAYALVAEADDGDQPRRALWNYSRSAPCLVLIDEWVAYARQLYDASDLARRLIRHAVHLRPGADGRCEGSEGRLLVGVDPGVDIEVGGEAGEQALDRLSNVIGRLEASWRPASAEEGFEIVRRRLFEDRSRNWHANATQLSMSSSSCTRSSRPIPVRVREATTSGGLRPPIRSTRSCSTGSSRTGRRSRSSSEPAVFSG